MVVLTKMVLKTWQRTSLLSIKIEDAKGNNIYTRVAKRGRVEHRLKEHLPGGKDPIRGGVKVKIQQKSSIDEAIKSEARIIKRQQPSQNKKGK